MQSRCISTRVCTPMAVTVRIHFVKQTEKVDKKRIKHIFIQLKRTFDSATITENNFMTFNGQTHSK